MQLDDTKLLSRTASCILLALSLQPRHGYELMEQIARDTSGRVRIGPGALYGTIGQLRDWHLIEDMPFEGDERRRHYRLTKKGWDRLEVEMRFYQQIVNLAVNRRAIVRD